jgi:tRNA-splicing ligase RtcB
MTDVHGTESAAAPIHYWVQGPLPRGVQDVLDRLRRTDGVARIAVMPDVHLASEFCVGTVVASPEMLYPNAVGGDIGCGMLAMRFAGTADVLDDAERAARLLGALTEACPGRRHHRRTGHTLPLDVASLPMSDAGLAAHRAGEDCRLQLGTLGAGNHFLELQAEDGGGDDRGTLWLMIHTGSRHLGQCVLHHHLPRARRLPTGVMALDADSSAGRAYLADVAAARAWAQANRRLLALRAAAAVERVLGAVPLFDTLTDCDHNHVETEAHAGRELFVHRKGATAAGAGVAGVVPGSMGTRSYHTVGRGNEDALCSSSHGAGRALSRTEARDRVTVSALRQQLRGVWYDARLERHLREEAPAAYKPIDAVMAAQADLTAVVRRLRPVLVYKGV